MRRWTPWFGGFAAGVVITLLVMHFTASTATAPSPQPIVQTTVPPAWIARVADSIGTARINAHKAEDAQKEADRIAAEKLITEKITAATTAAATKAAATKAATSNIDAAGAVQLIIPVKGIRASQLRDTYTDARGAGRKHDAIDIMAPHLTPVIAAAPAVVVKRDNGARGGIALYALAPDHKTIYYYAHLDHYAAGVVEGTSLKAGDVLGYVGNTGNAGPGNYHLHFEITTTADPKRYWGGVSHNPYPLLRKAITVN